ncbi:MAG: DUF2061 domain-containing protein [Acidimicrobiia bacterium]|nr:DUF2061 domain-containing protein [Acidimicrobiia bacterium]
METRARSLAKAISYRFFGSLSTAALVLFFTSDFTISLGAGLLDSLIKILLYFIHERAWQNISYGRPKAPEYEI